MSAPANIKSIDVKELNHISSTDKSVTPPIVCFEELVAGYRFWHVDTNSQDGYRGD